MECQSEYINSCKAEQRVSLFKLTGLKAIALKSSKWLKESFVLPGAEDMSKKK